MKVYVLCSYGDSLNDPSISTDYQEIYEKMEKSYKMVLEDVYQTEEEKEYTYISGYSALAKARRTSFAVDASVTSKAIVVLFPYPLFAGASD